MYISRDDPDFILLKQRYKNFGVFDHSGWKNFAQGIDFNNFRGESFYMAQFEYGMTTFRYFNTLEFMLQHGYHDMMHKLGEDNAFGCLTIPTTIEDIPFISRDLLDSTTEIDFLVQSLGLDAKTKIKAVDIGAGYGRLIYRMSQLFPESQVAGVDAIPESTYLCDKYLEYRGVDKNPFRAIPLYKMDVMNDFDLAINCYSFSECTLDTIEFWLQWIVNHNARYIFIVPHSQDFIHGSFHCVQADGTVKNYYPLFEQYGYKLNAKQPRFPYHLAKDFIFSTDYYLFERA